MKTMHKILAVAALVSPALLFSGGAAAQATYTWNLGGPCNAAGSPATASCVAGGETAGMSAWGSTGSGSSFVQGSIGNFDPSGMGAYTGSSESGTNGHHAFDNKTTACDSGAANTNCGGATELMLISFGPYKVRLTDVAIGWWTGDADISVLRWDGIAGSSPPSSAADTVANKSTAQLLSSGWTLVGSQDLATNGTAINNPNDGAGTSYAESGNSARLSNISLGSQVSSYWIISTYWGSTTGNLDKGNDAFKLMSFSATVCPTVSGGTTGQGGNGGTCGPSINVAEPSMLATLGLAVFGAGFARRRAQRQA